MVASAWAHATTGVVQHLHSLLEPTHDNTATTRQMLEQWYPDQKQEQLEQGQAQGREKPQARTTQTRALKRGRAVHSIAGSQQSNSPFQAPKRLKLDILTADAKDGADVCPTPVLETQGGRSILAELLADTLSGPDAPALSFASRAFSNPVADAAQGTFAVAQHTTRQPRATTQSAARMNTDEAFSYLRDSS